MTETPIRKRQQSALKEYAMPPACVGDVVIFHQDANPEDCAAALVVGVDPRSLSLVVFVKGAGIGTAFPTVRHSSDPLLVNADLQEDGTWDYTRQVTELHDELAMMRSMLEDLTRLPK